ncbi:uncharacterized protein L203_104728 [Cryptococcus depauperatus CBS 7841]|uniref:Uncharacterized protein n=1 Tax=Cryptococcus depauperatus CBS 7841 TaxID=1295531 RepID=A0AAJ8M2T3_9TREE
MPSVKLFALVTVRALDSLPLPFLMVVFVACLALLQLPVAPPSSLLPTHTSPSLSRRNPLTASLEKPARFHLIFKAAAASLPKHSRSKSYTYGATADKREQHIVYTVQSVRGNVRRNSKQLREWRSGLGVVEEVEGECEKEVV